ncbi:hypothetical protein JCM9279_001434 [Rhodotorula babjevae]
MNGGRHAGSERRYLRLWGSSYRLALDRPYSCPDPRLPLPSSLLDPRHLSGPVALPSSSPDFSLSLTYDTTVCNAFSLTVSRTDKAHCAAVEAAIEPSADAGLSAWIKARLGPDSFIVQVDGAERRMQDSPTRYRGECEYEFEFRLANAGPVWVNVTHANQDFNAFREDNIVAGTRHRPELLMTSLTAVPLELDICAPTCAMHYAPRLGFSLPPTFPPSRSALEPTLPSCAARARAGTLRGSYLPTRPVDQLYPPFALPYSYYPSTHSRTSSGYDAFVPAECAWAHAGLRFADHAPCVAREKKRVLFVGDSHARAAFDIVAVRLEGEGAVASTSVKLDVRNATVGRLFMEFLWDPFLVLPMTCELIDGFDAIVVSAGTHMAAFNCPTTSEFVSFFEARLAAIPALVEQCPSSATSTPPKLVLLNMPVQHQHLHDHDCRTGPRLAHWNGELSRVARREGWQVVDVEMYSRPNAIDQRIMDGIHYWTLDAAEPVADDLIDRLEICAGA